MLQNTHAQTGQDTNTLIKAITQDARKRAVQARTHAESIDVLHAALMAVAYLAKTEVRHGYSSDVRSNSRCCWV
jgi:imidazolonepropionase-like amidohydrolase